MNDVIATIEKYAYLKTPEFWVTTKLLNSDGAFRVGPFRSIRQVGVFLKQYGPDLPITFKNYEGWDASEEMVTTSSYSYNYKLFGGLQ